MANQWEKTPWMIGGINRSVPHSAGIARLLSYAAFGGEEGIVGALDLEVTAQAAPNGTVKVYPGACSIINRASGDAYEAYAARLPAADTVTIAPTGGASRTDLIIARVENPFEAGEPYAVPSQADIDAGVAEFVRTVVVSNVDPAIKSAREVSGGAYSAIALAKITIPASTATITQAMITDLRQMTNVRTDRGMSIFNPAGSGGDTLSSGAYSRWPDLASQSVDIPPWATDVLIRAFVTGAVITNGQFLGDFRGNLASGAAVTPSTSVNTPTASGTDRVTVIGGGSMKVPAALRGTTQNIKMEARKTSGASNLVADTHTLVSLEVEFSQSPGSNLS